MNAGLFKAFPWGRLFWVLPLLVLGAGALLLGPAWTRYRLLVAQGEALRQEIEALSRPQPLPPAKAEPLAPSRLPELYQAVLKEVERASLALIRFAPTEEGLTLSLEGTYEAVLALLEAIPRMDYPIWTEALTLSPLEPKATRFRAELEVRIRLQRTGER